MLLDAVCFYGGILGVRYFLFSILCTLGLAIACNNAVT